MNHIQALCDQGIITTMTVGVSALPYKGFFCFVRLRDGDADRIQGYGATVEQAIADTIARLPQQPRRPAATFQMPEVPVMRMPL